MVIQKTTIPQGSLIKSPNSRVQLIDKAVKNPPPPAAFRSLQTGPELDISYENQTTSQVELSDALLRGLSPFVIQVEPPFIFANAIQSLADTKTSSITTYGLVNNSNLNYQAARDTLNQQFSSGLNIAVDDAYQFAVQNLKPGNLKSVSDIDTSKVGEPAITDTMTAVDILWQLAAIAQMPPLVLLINPSSFRQTITKIQQYQDRSRYGYLLHTWGDDQLKLSITAKCGAFITGGKGVQAASRDDSVAWQNMMNLFHFYRNNGYIYDTIGKSNAHHLVGVLSISYDNWIYYGSMDSLSYTEDETNQLGGVEFSIEFTSCKQVDTSKQVFNVMPMRSPTPDVGDTRFAGHGKNQPGHYGIGMSGITNAKGLAATLVAGLGITIKGSATQGSTDIPVSSHAFKQTASTGSLSVNQAVKNAVQPFGIR